jgi:RHS repeat-associated protein
LVSGSTTATATYASYFYTRDHLGSVRELTDSTGTVRARYDYEVWGARSANKITAANAPPGKPPVETEMGFTGYRLHAATGQYLSPTRLYSPQLGRFTSQDPIGISGGLNLYAYCGGDPVNWTDVLGLATDIIVHRDAPDAGRTDKNRYRDAPGTMTVIHDGKVVLVARVNEYGFQEGSHGIHPGEDYRVLPRTDAVTKPKKSIFPNGTPAVTAPGETNPGNAGHGYKTVFIHAKGTTGNPDSRGCLTVAPEIANKIRDYVQSDFDKGEPSNLRIYNWGGVPYAVPTISE